MSIPYALQIGISLPEETPLMIDLLSTQWGVLWVNGETAQVRRFFQHILAEVALESYPHEIQPWVVSSASQSYRQFSRCRMVRPKQIGKSMAAWRHAIQDNMKLSPNERMGATSHLVLVESREIFLPSNLLSQGAQYGVRFWVAGTCPQAPTITQIKLDGQTSLASRNGRQITFRFS